MTPWRKGAQGSRDRASQALAWTHRTNYVAIQQVVKQSQPVSRMTFDSNRSGCENLPLAIISPYGVPCRHGNTACIITRGVGTDPTQSTSGVSLARWGEAWDLPQWQIPHLAFPLPLQAAFGQQQNLFNGAPNRQV